MERIPEPELMQEPEQVRAYAEADFQAPHEHFVALLRDAHPALPERGHALDLGCGPGDISFRFARHFPGWRVDGLDGSPSMLARGRRDADLRGLGERVSFYACRLPSDALPRPRYDLAFSNSLLHHLDDVAGLWATLRDATPGRPAFVMDLMRPASREDAEAMVARYAGDEPELLRRDFFHSLLAAYRVDEVRRQLADFGLDGLRVEAVSDRHWIARGTIPV